MEDTLLKTEQVADRLGISIYTVRAWIFKRRIPFVKLGGAVRFRPEDIEKIRHQGLPKQLAQY